ncbi:cob(I)yrinic acid a,c-diamide adenosyltransferase [Desulfovibrio psychrotolerans]|uniref:corrinoid adenosyltransferase n=1 Tax=Desulfovibrio psychrotolerans TaxID=415242 RepID=A0A7J0BNS2_9BACT|nr:cob(I)yrinic acid a,c-diamide adenosyltransferase [Desulfovibrio psychrotolerans]GFM35336.1 cob(I)alamin adenosyltransferase [Desulfovibrio psychrotolerans]
MILVYTGNGKGKTSASVGQTIRALGQGFVVAFGQFMKRADQAGEQKILSSLLKERFHAEGKGFLTRPDQFAEHREASLQLLLWATHQLEDVDMLVLDEALYALKTGLLHEEELRSLVDQARTQEAHLVLSGRDCPQWLTDAADTVTEMTEIKHHYAQGIPAQRGIEF